MKLIKKIIIYLFEKYAYDYWVDLQTGKENKRLLEKYDTDDLEEAIECEIQESREPERLAYNAGRLYAEEDERTFY